MTTLTAANVSIQFTVPPIFTSPHLLQQFAADDIFNTESLEAAEISMGVDGIMSAGFIYSMVNQDYSLQGDSQSIAFFDQWYFAQKTNGDLYYANAVAVFPGLQTKYNMVKGVLKNYPPVASAGKIVKPRKFNITWESATPAPL